MRSIFTHLTAGLLFIHAVLGCCWHHAHDCDHCAAKVTANAEGPTRQLPAAFSLLANHACQEACHDAHDGQSPGPCPCKFECQGVCTYLPPQKANVDIPGAAGWQELFAVPPRSFASQVAGFSGAEHCPVPVIAPPSLRRHLLYQILLI